MRPAVASCLSDDTELLTKRGWISYTDIQDDDKVLGMNTRTDKSEWQKIYTLVITTSNTIHRVNTPRLDMATTETSKVFCRGHKSAIWKFQDRSVIHDRAVVPVARIRETAVGVDWSEAHIQLAAWILTDGSEHVSGDYIIYQSKVENIDHIQNVINACGYMAAHFVRNRDVTQIGGSLLKGKVLPQHSFHIIKEYRQKLKLLVPRKGALPQWSYDMTRHQFMIFLAEYIRGDGTWYNGNRSGAIIYGTKNILDELQILCLLNGVSASVKLDNRGDYRLNVCFKQDTGFSVKMSDTSVEPYKGKVWALGVPLSNFMIRRNGIPHFTCGLYSNYGSLYNDLPLTTNICIPKCGLPRAGLEGHHEAVFGT